MALLVVGAVAVSEGWLTSVRRFRLARNGE
jgi:hypothetical protein